MAKANIYVLGIHDGHNAGAALLKNGKVLAAINEERLNNVKNFAQTPRLAIKKVFEIAGVKPQDVDLVALASFLRIEDPTKSQNNKLQILTENLAPYFHDPLSTKLAVKFLSLFRKGKDLNDRLKELGIDKKPQVIIEHHLAHAACAYYSRPWEEKSLILTLDGMGDGISATVNIGQGFKIKRIAQTSFYDSLANNLFSEITAFLGMNRWSHEYKVMGLAPYGNPQGIYEDLQKLFGINPKNSLEFENKSGAYLKKMQPVYQKILRGKRFDHIAAATQKLFQELVTTWVKNAIAQTKIHKLVCAGGAFLNVKTNMQIRALDEVDDVFFYPAADDGGCAVGAALHAYYDFCAQNKITPEKHRISDIYYGQQFTKGEILDFLKSAKILNKAQEASSKQIAKLLSLGKIIGRFCDRDEWGPRALGNRSILADPRNTAVVRRLNAIKNRDFWMPFAPAILEENQKKYLKKSRFAPYMIEAFDTLANAQDIIATLHPQDLTARVQTVNDWNPGFAQIIRDFRKITGVGALLNTSFNIHGYPLVGSPKTAYWTFKNSGLDALVLEDFLILKK